MYHYHLEPLWLTGKRGAATLIGVLLDGFPVYGPGETDGSSPKGLDSCNAELDRFVMASFKLQT